MTHTFIIIIHLIQISTFGIKGAVNMTSIIPHIDRVSISDIKSHIDCVCFQA
jgi:hypothetical protein